MKPPSNSLLKVLEQFGDLEKRALDAYTPLVNDLIQSECRDTNLIERTLDHLLGFAGDADISELYRSLCKYLATLDKEAAHYYTAKLSKLHSEENPDR